MWATCVYYMWNTFLWATWIYYSHLSLMWYTWHSTLLQMRYMSHVSHLSLLLVRQLSLVSHLIILHMWYTYHSSLLHVIYMSHVSHLRLYYIWDTCPGRIMIVVRCLTTQPPVKASCEVIPVVVVDQHWPVYNVPIPGPGHTHVCLVSSQPARPLALTSTN